MAALSFIFEYFSNSHSNTQYDFLLLSLSHCETPISQCDSQIGVYLSNPHRWESDVLSCMFESNLVLKEYKI
jgi:hypothetical protein